MTVISIVLLNRDVASYFEMEGPDRKLQGQMNLFVFISTNRYKTNVQWP